MRAAAANGLPAGVTVNVTGRDALDEANTHDTSGGSGVLLEALIGGLGALVILLFVFGTLPAILMPLVIALASILNTFTLVWALTYITDVSVIVQFLIALVGLGVAIDDALLMIFHFRDELREGNDVESALVETMTHAGHSVIVSGTTVAVGLLAMVVLPLPLLRGMGIGGMLIPVVSVLATLTLLPALLSVLGTRINSVRVMPKQFIDGGHPSSSSATTPSSHPSPPAPPTPSSSTRIDPCSRSRRHDASSPPTANPTTPKPTHSRSCAPTRSKEPPPTSTTSNRPARSRQSTAAPRSRSRPSGTPNASPQEPIRREWR